MYTMSSLMFFFFFNDTATTEIYTLSLHDALPISALLAAMAAGWAVNNLAFVLVLVLNRQQRPGRVLAALVPGIGTSAAVTAGNLAFGVLFAAAYAWLPTATVLFVLPLALLHWANRAYAAVRADRARLEGMQRAMHALGVPIDPRAALSEFLHETRTCFESETADLIVIGPPGRAGGTRTVHRSSGGQPAYRTFQESMNSATLATALLELHQPMRVKPGT